MARLSSGDARAADCAATHGLQLNAFDPQNFVWHNTLAYAQLFAGEPGLALASSSKAQEIRPDWAPAIESALCALRAQEDERGARECAAKLCAMPRDAGTLLGPMRRNNPLWDRAIADWLADPA